MSNIALIVEYGLFFFVLGTLIYILTHDNYNE